jgi:hypothetical protein
MANNKKIRNAHAAKYIEAVFAPRLREEGFFCPDERLLCWYRIKNNEIIHSVFFFSCWSNLPLLLQIAYGVHPLFVTPHFMTDVYCPGRPLDERFHEMTIQEGDARLFAPYSDEALVYCPQADGYGVDTFNSVILPILDSIDSMEKCYDYNKKIIRGNVGKMSITAIDEAIYLNDSHAIDDCKEALAKRIPHYQNLVEMFPNNKEYADALVRLYQQENALYHDQREAFLRSIEQRKQKTIKFFRKKFGITLDV